MKSISPPKELAETENPHTSAIHNKIDTNFFFIIPPKIRCGHELPAAKAAGSFINCLVKKSGANRQSSIYTVNPLQCTAELRRANFG